MAGSIGKYSFLDRLVHRLAFAGVGVQLSAADIEDRMFKSELATISADNPIFITSLPRAGTTILLMALANLPGMATHLYRDMPFVMAPLLWSKLSGRFRQSAEVHERAHGDGIKIGPDSPEAFEEMIWRAFWPDHYRADQIVPWSLHDTNGEAAAFMNLHFRKIVALRAAEQPGRYLSKNNANISRLALIPNLFPGAKIIVPIRAPITHATSLLRQHRNFMKMHADDPFTLRYMRDIGHYEFGHLHKPIAFAGFDELSKGLTPMDLDYWLAYWIAAFENVANSADHIYLLSYEELCANGRAGAAGLCDFLNLEMEHANQIGDYFRPMPPMNSDSDLHRSLLRDRAEELHKSLLSRTITAS